MKKMNHIFRRSIDREKEKKRSDGRKAARANLSIAAVVSVLVISLTTAMLATAAEPPAPFHVYGWVKYSNGTAVLNPNMNITNHNTSENYNVETNASSNYYQVITSSCNVSAGDVLYFNASDNGNSTNCSVTVTSENMTDGGLFEQNLAIQLPQVGICGDVNDDGEIDMADVMTLWYDFADYPYPGAHTIANAWAADVNCDGEIDMADVMTLWYDFADYPYPGAHVVNCC